MIIGFTDSFLLSGLNLAKGQESCSALVSARRLAIKHNLLYKIPGTELAPWYRLISSACSLDTGKYYDSGLYFAQVKHQRDE
jgi:hypothetical protein